MNKKWKAKWVKALRSGKYTQGRYQLKSADNQYCCLGVLAEIQGAKWQHGKPHLKGVCIRNESEQYLTPKGSAGMKYTTQRRLGDMNDEGGMSFDEIANYIEKRL